MATFGFQIADIETEDARSRDRLYDSDFFRWTEEQARLLRQGEFAQLDIENLVDEVETLGRSVKREIESRLGVLSLHLLKWRFQPAHRSGSWKGTIVEQRFRLARELNENPSLRGYPAVVLSEEYEWARLKAAGETGLAEDVFPVRCPFTIEEILDEGFYPEEQGSAGHALKEDR